MTATNAQVRVLIADDRALVCDMLGHALATQHEIHVLGHAITAESAAFIAGQMSPDVTIFGVAAREGSVEDGIHRLLLACPSCAVVALAESEEDERLVEALRAGAIGFITLATPLETVVQVLLSAALQQTVLPAEFTQRILDMAKSPTPVVAPRAVSRALTEREVEILQLLMRGLANAEIARNLGVSTNTVKNHLNNIYRKLGVTSRSQAFATASQLGIAV